MPTQTTVSLVDSIVREAGATGPGASILAEQAAVVRALVDELERRHPAEERIAALHAQLGEEVSRLASLLGHGAGALRSADPIEVLVVDDEEASLRAIATAARALGYPCRAANDAQTALELQDSRPASVVITDWNMPEISGLDLCRMVKARGHRAFVILVTAFYDEAHRRTATRAGVDGLLPKPLDMSLLEVRLHAVADLARANRLLDEAMTILEMKHRKAPATRGTEGE